MASHTCPPCTHAHHVIARLPPSDINTRGRNIGTYNLDMLQSARSISNTAGARVVLMHYKWDPQIERPGDFQRSVAVRRRMWWPYGDNIQGKFSSAPTVDTMLTAKNSRVPLLGTNDGQWRNLVKYQDSGGSNKGQRLLTFYLTLTQTLSLPPPNVYENTRSQVGARVSLLNDLAKIALVNFQHNWGFANFLMVDFYGDDLWTNQQLTVRAQQHQERWEINNPILELCILLSTGHGNELTLPNPVAEVKAEGKAKAKAKTEAGNTELPVLSTMRRR